MVQFSGKILVIGCGGVAQCTLPILIQQIKMPPKNITVIDFEDNRHKIKEALSLGVQFHQTRITPENFREILQTYLSVGDICLDLAWNLGTLEIIDWCHYHGVRYLNTSVEVWDPFENFHEKSPADLTLYPRNMALRAMADKWDSKHGPTAIVDHGANPGLVSHFTKHALLEMGEKIAGSLGKSERRKKLEESLSDSNFANIAQVIGLKTIHISERDTQIINVPKAVDEFVNTWSVAGFIEEGMAPAELGWGTHERKMPHGAIGHSHGPKNQILLPKKGVNTWVRSFIPSGEITGMLVRHGEAFGMSDYLTVWEDGQAVYRPTVHYVYCPCDAALNSIHELQMRHYQPQPKTRIVTNEIISGADELGCLLLGHDLNAWWVGTILDIDSARQLVPGQNATTVQVAAGVVSGLVYMINHPNNGFLLPDHVEHQEVLNIAKPFLGQFVSKAFDWSPLTNAKDFAEFNQPLPAKEDEWQFSTFLLH